jgi:hypothetical protein
VSTSKEPPPSDSQRARRRVIAQGTKVPHDEPAEAPVRLDTDGHKGVTRVQMARLLLAPIMQSSSSRSVLGGGGNIGQAARMDHGNVQQGGTVGRGKGHFNVGPCPLTANICNADGSVTGLRTRITARTGRDALTASFPWSCRRERLLLRRWQLVAWSISLPSM